MRPTETAINTGGGNGFIRGLHMDHYVVTSNDDYVQQDQPRAQRQEAPYQDECEEFVEAIMIDDRRKSCARTTMDDVGYLCGCGASPIDDAEVVYVKRGTATPKHADFSDRREDVTTGRYDCNITSPRLNRDYREDNFDANPEDLLYSSPARVGCMPSGVIDLLTPGCGLQPRRNFNGNRTRENNITAKMNFNKKEENPESRDGTNNDCDDKQENYDEWKKQVLDTVKAPSFNTIEVELASDPSDRKDSNGTSDLPFKHQYQSRNQWQETGTQQRNTLIANDPPDSKVNRQHVPSLSHDHELNQLRSEHLFLRQTREELQTELEAAKRYNRDMLKRTSTIMPRGDSSVFSLDDVHRMRINQKFDDVMSIASPRSSMDRVLSMDMMMAGRHPISQRSSSANWNGGVTSPNGLGHLPSSPLGMSGSYTISSPFNAGHQEYHPQLMSPSLARGNNNNLFPRHDLDAISSHFARSPASMMSGGNDHYGYEPAASSGWRENHEGQHWSNNVARGGHRMSSAGFPESPFYGVSKKYQDEEELLNEMRMKSAAMEEDIMRMKGSMSQRFQPNGLQSYVPDGKYGGSPLFHGNIRAYGHDVTSPDGIGVHQRRSANL